ncbi:MAG: ferrochelatase [Planctomycetaceae bacterium]
MPDYEAVLLVGFGGPESRDDVLPFLENVTRGRRVPRERLLEVAEHYYRFGGVSPLNEQVRALKTCLENDLVERGIALPVYWGNRNWHPLLADTMAEMAAAGVKRALAIILSAYSSYSSCRQYLENLDEARRVVGRGAPQIDKTRAFFNHPGFVSANADCLRKELNALDEEARRRVHVAFTAHSIPRVMAEGCRYESQLNETSRLVAEACGVPPQRWQVVYQSRSGRPQDPWLGPDILDHLRSLEASGSRTVIAHPIGFLSDHLEVLFDLDVEATELAGELQMAFRRAATVGVHLEFVGMLGQLVEERCNDSADRPTCGEMDASGDVCPVDCCPPGHPVEPTAGR